ncbi:MAG TPA: hypothetical protein VHX88_12680, partial [Solirubrobacteraceae bacterium]|nr:hypothetical protein [Solirubrobacteraceae bacterium]
MRTDLERRRRRRSHALRCALGGAAAALALGSADAHAATASCAPGSLNRTAVLPGTPLAVSPLPDSLDASTQTQISMLGAPASAITAVTVSGSRSGTHTGHLEAYSQGDGASFVPSSPFRTGETVTVRGHVSGTPFAFRFTIAQQDPIPIPTPRPNHPPASALQSFHSAPTLQAPRVAITTSSPAAAPGDLFAAVYGSYETGGPMIFAPNGQLVWFDPLALGQ